VPDDALVIELRDVCVHYRLPRERIPTFKEFAIKWLRGSVVYDDLLALAHVDLRVRAGESVGIIGRNGAGKTTLMKVIARVLRPKEGQVTSGAGSPRSSSSGRASIWSCRDARTSS